MTEHVYFNFTVFGIEKTVTDLREFLRFVDGENRATYLQTRTLVETHTARVDRGTPAFMAPEAYLRATRSMTKEDLKRADIWSFAMIVYCLMNPYKHADDTFGQH